MDDNTIIRPELDDELKKLTASRQGASSLLLTAIVGLLFSFVMLFLTDLRTACLIGLAALAFDFFMGRPARKKRAKRLTADQALFGTGGMLSYCSYQEKSELPKDILQELSLSDRTVWNIEPICRHMLRGRYIESNVTICECSIGVKWGEKKTDVTFLSGTLITADAGKKLDTDFVCISEKATQLTDEYKGYLSNGYQLAGECKNGAKILKKGSGDVPGWLIKGIEKLQQDDRKGLSLSYIDGRLAIFVLNSFYAEKVNSGIPATEGILKQCHFRERDIVFDIIRKMQQ